jgi:hypothetical protein
MFMCNKCDVTCFARGRIEWLAENGRDEHTYLNVAFGRHEWLAHDSRAYTAVP